MRIKVTIFNLVLNFRRFHFQFLKVSHANAKTKCEELNGRLAEPRTDAQFKAVQFLDSLSLQFWLGGEDPHQNRTFVYLSDGEEIKSPSPYWGQNEPNNRRNREFCLAYRNSGFNDLYCGSMRPFVCEFGPTGNVSVCETGNDFLFN